MRTCGGLVGIVDDLESGDLISSRGTGTRVAPDDVRTTIEQSAGERERGEKRMSSVPGLNDSPKSAIRFPSRFHTASSTLVAAALTASSFSWATSRSRPNPYPNRAARRSSAATSFGKQ